MTQRNTSTAIITDQQAEGSSQSHDEREPVNPARTVLTPASRPNSPGSLPRTSPVAETGVVPVVVFAEGDDDSDTQDASLTIAETQRIAVPQPQTSPTEQLSALIVEDTLELAEILQVTLERMHMVTAHESH